ncbi:carboxymuconolactone decarboxylase family protein [Dyadobacter sp. CY326]|uniref:carboxymuconolactone decarboxylase family protein n=1 Tax=Dyadobacter sp. CY326 TaxID=2907300 RepID=UPI001EEA448B|nr:peroxidase-related enzyme [Dyadobacter sp. CY326]MCE7063906.1 peroxidase-related enzyme [Dyadobacter sp. CY326]
MPHIKLQDGVPGILGPMKFSPKTAEPLNALANALLLSDEGLTRGERELIGAYVSSLNDCFFCQTIHGAVASAYYDDDDWSFMNSVKTNYQESTLSEKMKALLSIAGSVQKGGKNVSEAQVAAAKLAGADDRDIHDTVLIAAAFCMFNRYVDGLATTAPSNPAIYKNRAENIVKKGYSGDSSYDPY